MEERRSVSQILYNFLPQQTVDLQGDVWKVSEWSNPVRIADVDQDDLNRALRNLIAPWEHNGLDSGLGKMLKRNTPIEVYGVNPENGVQVESFPKIWVCRYCKRIRRAPDKPCKCGKQAFSSFHMIGYHDQCGAVREPPMPYPCKEHNDLAVEFGGGSKGSELRFLCPTCKKTLRTGFPPIPCTCGKDGNYSFTVHRAGGVYASRSVVRINASRKEHREAIAQVGGRARALAWVLDGMKGSVTDAPATEASVRKALEAQNLPPQLVEDMIAKAKASNNLSNTTDIPLPALVKADAEDQAASIAIASLSARKTIDQLSTEVPIDSGLRTLYADQYVKALREAGLESVELYDRFSILSGSFGYTRGALQPGESALVPYLNKARNAPVVYAAMVETEALFFKLDPLWVASWLRARGWEIADFNDAHAARVRILEACLSYEPSSEQNSIEKDLFTLVHTYAHRVMRAGALFAGVDRNSLAEVLVPLHLGFFIYTSARGDFVLGGLSAVFESQLHEMLHSVVHDERRCAMDPGCSKNGGACICCLHVGEPSCRNFNMRLDRGTLFGRRGYLSPKLRAP